MVWYQKFEYALAHWLQKSAEHNNKITNSCAYSERPKNAGNINI
jgi:hypothetical protein